MRQQSIGTHSRVHGTQALLIGEFPKNGRCIARCGAHFICKPKERESPMMEEGMSIKGSITLLLAKPTGEVEVVHKDNIIVNGGFDFVADAIGNAGSRPGVMGWIAVGTGTTAAASTQTALVTEI